MLCSGQRFILELDLLLLRLFTASIMFDVQYSHWVGMGVDLSTTSHHFAFLFGAGDYYEGLNQFRLYSNLLVQLILNCLIVAYISFPHGIITMAMADFARRLR